MTTTDFTTAQTVWVGVTDDGKISRTHSEALPEGLPRHLLRVSTHETLYLVNTSGQAAAVAVHTLPEAETFDEGAPLYKASALDPEDRLAFLFTLPPASGDPNEHFIMTATRSGMLKKSLATDLPGPSSQRFVLAKVNPDDELVAGMVTDGKAVVWLITAQGMSIRFGEDEVRPIGLVSAGVMGIKLGEGDAVAAMLPWQDKLDLALLASNGVGWRVAAKEFPLQGRHGQGVIACRVAKGSELIGGAVGNAKASLLVHFQKGNVRRVMISDFPLSRRGGKGGVVVPVKPGDEVIGLANGDNVDIRKSSKPTLEKKDGGPIPNGTRPASPTPAGKARKTAAPPKAQAASASGKKTSTAEKAPAPLTEQVKPSGRQRAPAKPGGSESAAVVKAKARTAAGKASGKTPIVTAGAAAGGAEKPKGRRKEAAPPIVLPLVTTRRKPSAAKQSTAAANVAVPAESKRGKGKSPELPAADKKKAGSSAVPAAGRKKRSGPPSAEQQPLPGLTEAKPKPKPKKP